jgi:hypothetical protein
MNNSKNGLTDQQIPSSTNYDQVLVNMDSINSAEDLNRVLTEVEQGLISHDIPPIHVLVLLRSILRRQDVYSIINDENRVIAARVWNNLRGNGIQLDIPPLLLT